MMVAESTRVQRKVLLTAVAVAGAWLGSPNAEAFPGFARKYSPTTSISTFMPCSGCHDTFPKLTPFGRRFKENGFRMDGDVVGLLDAVKAVPVAFRSTSFSQIAKAGGDSTSGVVKVVSAAGLGSHLSYWVDQPFYFDSDGVDRVPINYAWVGAYDIVPGVRPGLVNVRGGSFELELPFPQAKTHNLFAYEPYFLTGGDDGFSLSTPQRGFEISGRPTDWGRYTVSFSDGVRRSTQTESRYDPDLYARFSTDIGPHRFGGFFYDGRDELTLLEPDSRTRGSVVAEHRRVGADFDLRHARSGLSLFGMYLVGRDELIRGQDGTGNGGLAAVDSHGGFVQVEKLTTSWLMVTARYAQVHENDMRRSLALGAYSWLFERLRLTFEYRLQDGGRDDEGLFSIDFVL